MIQKCPGPSRPSTPSTRPTSTVPTTSLPQSSNRFDALPVDPIPDTPSEPSPTTVPPQSLPPLTPQTSPFSVIPKSTNCRKHSLYIPVSVIISLTTLNTVTTTALVDSGAQISCIDWAFITHHRIPTIPLKNPFPICDTDQTSNIYCQYEVITYVKIGSITQQVRLYAINGGKENIILGHPWLEQTNPSIDWNKGTVTISETKDQSLGLSFAHLGARGKYLNKNTCPSYTSKVNPRKETTLNPIEQTGLCRYLSTELPEQFTERAVDSFIINCIQWCGSKFLTPAAMATINKLTMSTDLAMKAEAEKPKKTLPPEYAEYSQVFSKEATDHVPPCHPYDHTINLKESFVPKIGKLYPLSVKEREAADDFIDENLRSGKIRPSKSPQASPFFFVKKKDGGLRPCQDYRYLNEHTIRDTYPLPLISDLIDKLKDAKVFMKFDVRWGYNNVCIKEGDQWKAAFITHRGLYEPTVMFFGMTNSPPTFQ